MVDNYKVVTLCGSTRFKEDFLRVTEELTFNNIIVISVGVFGHQEKRYTNIKMTDKVKAMLDDMHKKKINMADEIFVINKDGYIGSSTRSEIEYALAHHKAVNFLEDVTLEDIKYIHVNGRTIEDELKCTKNWKKLHNKRFNKIINKGELIV